MLIFFSSRLDISILLPLSLSSIINILLFFLPRFHIPPSPKDKLISPRRERR
jgi:hypothetical protein